MRITNPLNLCKTNLTTAAVIPVVPKSGKRRCCVRAGLFRSFRRWGGFSTGRFGSAPTTSTSTPAQQQDSNEEPTNIGEEEDDDDGMVWYGADNDTDNDNSELKRNVRCRN